MIGQKLLEPKQLRGGGSSQLISGISSEQVSKFVTALKNGEKFDFYNKAAFFGYEYECCE